MAGRARAQHPASRAQNRFVKAHALGNDYLVLEPAKLSFELGAEAVRRLCDRHHGVGSDGLLARVPSRQADAGLRIWNPDGSQAEKSGNGLRIFAKYLWEHGRLRRRRFTVETPGGVVACELHLRGERVREISVDMGRASFRSTDVPCSGPPREVVDETIQVAGRTLVVTAVGIGNPHCVVLVDDVAAADLSVLGPALERHPLFPNRTNVQLVRVEAPDRVRLRIWERGAGETLASGSSACAVAAACRRLGRTGGRITAVMDGGVLQLQVSDDYRVRMRGPASEVCRGVLAPDLVDAL